MTRKAKGTTLGIATSKTYTMTQKQPTNPSTKGILFEESVPESEMLEMVSEFSHCRLDTRDRVQE